jgi:hypothetical protein
VPRSLDSERCGGGGNRTCAKFPRSAVRKPDASAGPTDGSGLKLRSDSTRSSAHWTWRKTQLRGPTLEAALCGPVGEDYPDRAGGANSGIPNASNEASSATQGERIGMFLELERLGLATTYYPKRSMPPEDGRPANWAMPRTNPERRASTSSLPIFSRHTLKRWATANQRPGRSDLWTRATPSPLLHPAASGNGRACSPSVRTLACATVFVKTLRARS